MTFSKLNENEKIILLANGLLIFICFLIFQVLASLYQRSVLLDNPLLAKELFYQISQEQITAGMFSIVGLLIMIILKSLKQNILIVIIGVLTVGFYYL